MRVPFSDVFATNPDGSFSTRSQVQIGSAALSQGASFRPGALFSGVDITQYVGHDLEVEHVGGVVVVRGVLLSN